MLKYFEKYGKNDLEKLEHLDLKGLYMFVFLLSLAVLISGMHFLIKGLVWCIWIFWNKDYPKKSARCEIVSQPKSMQGAFYDLFRSDEFLDMEEVTDKVPPEENDDEVSEMDENLEEMSKNETAMVDA